MNKNTESVLWSTERVEQLIRDYNEKGILPKRNPFYNGDVRQKKPRISYSYTEEELLELAKVQESVLYFSENHAKVTTDDGIRKIKLRPYQTRVLLQLEYYRHNVILASRQIGKSKSWTSVINCYNGDVRICDMFGDTFWGRVRKMLYGFIFSEK